jgi:hypothetical protein
MQIKHNPPTMKKLFVFVIICYFALPVRGQISVGISTGPSLSTMSVHLRDLSTFRIKPIFGFNLNFIVDIKLNSSLSLSSGMSFSQKGFWQTLYYQYSPFMSAEMTSHINYLEIPVYIKINTNLTRVNFFYGVGPYFSYGLNGKVSTLTTGSVDSSYTEEIKWAKSSGFIENDLPNTYGYTSIKRFDYGIGNMVGLKYKQLFLTLDYRYSFKNIMWEYYLDEKISNSVLSLSAGYIF